MTPFTTLTSVVVPLIRDNVDTDTIIPSREMTSTGKTGLKDGLFAPWRYSDAVTRTPNPDFAMNRPEFSGARILASGANFGCGSSREHAAWALGDMGIRVVIAPSFSDIFSGNAVKNGILPVVLPQEAVDRLLEVAREGVAISVDLEHQTVTTPYQDRFTFALDPFRRDCLLGGLDEVGLTMARSEAIGGFEASRAAAQPWLTHGTAAA